MLSSIRVIKRNQLVKTSPRRVLQMTRLKRGMAICVLTLGACLASACGGGKTVASDLTERDAIEIVDLLWEKKINAEKGKRRSRVAVSSGALWYMKAG